METNQQTKFFIAPPSNPIITGQSDAIPKVHITNPITVGPEPVRVYCPACRSDIQTIRRYQSSGLTHITAVLLLSICCCCLPYCIESCRNVDHYCPKCNTYIGTYR